MPTFGQNETEQRLHLSGLGALYVLKADPKRVVKVLQPPEGIWSDEQLADEILAFRVRARTQELVAKSSKHFAPIYEVASIREGTEGSSGGGEAIQSSAEGVRPRASGAYAVMDRYERSVQSLIDGRVYVTNDDLRVVFSSVIQGLLDIRKVARRPHGNLRPSNILLADSADLAKATVHLSDPAAESALTANSHNKDLADIARIVYELVNQRPYQTGVVGRTKEWDRLGPNGADWRKLCNALLDAHAPAEERDLGKILAAIDTWRAPAKKSKKPLIAAAAAFVLIAGSLTAWLLLRHEKVNFDQERWNKFAIAYISWFKEIEAMDPATREKFRANPQDYPAAIADHLDQASKDLDKYTPASIAQDDSKSDARLAANPNDYVKNGDGPRYTRDGFNLIQKIDADLATWPLLVRLRGVASQYDKNEWHRAAAGIQAVIASTRPPVLTPPVGPAADLEAWFREIKPINMVHIINDTVSTGTMITAIDGRWAHIQQEIANIPQTHIPLIDAFADFARSVPRSTVDPTASAPGINDVKALDTSFTKLEPVASALATDLTDKTHPLDLSALAADLGDKAHPLGVAADSTPSFDAYARLHGVLESGAYVELDPDPRGTFTHDATVEAVDTDIRIISERNKQDENLAKLVSDRQNFASQIALWQKTPAIQKNRKYLNGKVEAARVALAALHQNSDAWSRRYKITPQDFINHQTAVLASRPALLADVTPVIYEHWKQADATLLAKASTPESMKHLADWAYLQKMDGTFTALQTIYKSYDAKIPPVAALASVGGEKWRQAIATRVAENDRTAALADLMDAAAAHPVDDLPQLDESAVSARRAAYDQLCADALRLIDNFTTIEDRLNSLNLQRDEPARGAVWWADLFNGWKIANNPLLKDQEIVAAIEPISSRASAVLSTEALVDYKSLLAATSGNAPEIVLTAWRRLGTVPVNEAIPVLKDEDAAEVQLKKAVDRRVAEKFVDAQRHDAILSEVTVQRAARWRRWANTLASAQPIEEALRRRPEFVREPLSAEAEPAMFFNAAFLALNDEAAQAGKQNAIDKVYQSLAERFIDSVHSMPQGVQTAPGVAALIARFQKTIAENKADAADVSSSQLEGPELAGWTRDKQQPRTDVRIFYSPSLPRQTLEFARMQVNDKTIFLCTKEMSVGLFADIVNSTGSLSAMDNAKATNDPHWLLGSDTAGALWGDYGPRSWRIESGQVKLDLRWLSEDASQMGGKAWYPNGELPPPSYDMPVQLISPWTAMYVAHLFGCRIPTSQEFATAYEKFEVHAPATEPKDAWNLRGEKWQAQQDYSKLMSQNAMSYPDQNIFLTKESRKADPKITDDAAQPWHYGDLAKLLDPVMRARLSSVGPEVYKGSTIWFRPTGQQPGRIGQIGAMNDLIGNVAEFIFDGPTASAIITAKENKPTIQSIDALIAGGEVSVIGGSALSPPLANAPFYEKKPVDLDYPATSNGFCDVGFRLAYTAPIDSMKDVLADVFRNPKFLPGPDAGKR